MVDTLRIEHLFKTFPGQSALVDVELSIAPGEVHALVGQNGSGKSTLIKVLAGYHQPDPGSFASVHGRNLVLGDAAAAAAMGIRFVHQDLGLVNMLNTVENLALTTGFKTGAAGRIRWSDEVRRAEESMGELGMGEIDVRAPVATLAPSQRTAVAIARAVSGWRDGGISLLVLDEPTATLPGADVKRLFSVIHRLRSTGVSILYVSHHLDEVFELADQVTVLRDAHRIASVPVAELDHDRLVELIVGHSIATGSAVRSSTTDRPVLTVRSLSGGNVVDLDLDVYPGEVVGLAGITGSGREHVLDLLAGQRPRTSGDVWLDGTGLDNYAPPSAIEAGAAFVPADRSVKGAIGSMTVRENLTIADLRPFFSGGRLSRPKEMGETRAWIERLSIKTRSSEAPIGSLSGGNQQKVMFGKALRQDPKLLLLDEPTQGIDVGAKDQIHALIDEASSKGVATIVASTDTDELIRLCQRVLVLIEGRVTEELTGDMTAEQIEHAQLQSPRRDS